MDELDIGTIVQPVTVYNLTTGLKIRGEVVGMMVGADRVEIRLPPGFAEEDDSLVIEAFDQESGSHQER